MDIDKEILSSEENINNANIAIKNVNEQINIYNLKRQELIIHSNYLKGCLDTLKYFKKETCENNISNYGNCDKYFKEENKEVKYD